MKRLRWIDSVKDYMRASEIFTLYVPKETDCYYRLQVSKLMNDYQYVTERFHNSWNNYLLFYPKEFIQRWSPEHDQLTIYRWRCDLIPPARLQYFMGRKHPFKTKKTKNGH